MRCVHNSLVFHCYMGRFNQRSSNSSYVSDTRGMPYFHVIQLTTIAHQNLTIYVTLPLLKQNGIHKSVLFTTSRWMRLE